MPKYSAAEAFTPDFLLRVSMGEVTGYSIRNVFGSIAAAPTVTPAPICSNGLFQRPEGTQALEILSSSANDTALGDGARTVIVRTINTDWDEEDQIIPLNGTTPVAIPNAARRVNLLAVATCGSFGDGITTGANEGTITVRDLGGIGVDWAEIEVEAGGHGAGISHIGCRTFGRNVEVLPLGWDVSMASNKNVNIQAFSQSSLDIVPLPDGSYLPGYTAIDLVEQTGFAHVPFSAREWQAGPVDYVWLALAAANSSPVNIKLTYLEKDLLVV